jgi:hypothetical protein
VAGNLVPRPGLDLTSITAAPDGTAWATGDSQPSSSTGTVQAPLILHWIAGTWQQVPPPANDWWPVQITATPSGVWLAAQAAYRVDPLHSGWEVILARRTADGWQAVRAPAMGGASGFLATGGTLGLAAVRGSVWVAAAAPPPVKIGGPPISVAPPSPPATLLRWSAGEWSVVTSQTAFDAVIAGPAGPVLITPQARAAPDDMFTTVAAPMAGFTASDPGPLAQPVGQPGQVASVPGTSRLWAVSGNWIARYP